MNLYIFNENRRGAVFGIGTYIQELIIALKHSGIRVCVVNLLSEKHQIIQEKIDDVRYWYFPEPIPEVRTTDAQEQRQMYFHNVVYLLRLYITEKKDIVFHLNFPQCGNFVDELKETFKCKIVSVVHFSHWGFVVFDNLTRLRNILKEEQSDSLCKEVKEIFEEDKMFYSKVDRCICLSKYMYKILCQDYELDETKVSIIPNGLSDTPNIDSVSSSILREKWHLQDWEKIVLFAGRIDEVKGIIFLIRAFREVLKECPNTRLVIAGNGNYESCFQELQTICTKVTFTGLLEKKELYEFYRMANVGVVPSLFEPFGYVAVEMMIHALPLVVTETSGLAEVVDDTCGIVVPIVRLPDRIEINVSILAQKIIYLLKHPVDANKLGQGGRGKYLREYASQIFGKNMIQLYTSL